MAGKFMAIKRLVIPVISLIIFASQLAGCAAASSSEMVDMINEGQTIVLEVNEPTTYAVSVKGEQKQDVSWIQLDQLKTFNQGFRQGFDELMNINTVTDGTSGKQGCLFVINDGGKDVRSGNTTIADAFRNKAFVTKYWASVDVQTKLAELSSQAYSDVDENSPYAIEASLNAYYNLFNDSVNPDAFNPTKSVSREEFYTVLFKSENGVRDLGYYADSDEFASAVGGDTAYTMYAKQVAQFGFLQTENGSLDKSNISGSISRAEAVYMIVMQNFADIYQQMDAKSPAYSDNVCGGDVALKVGFKTSETRERQNAETGKTEKYQFVTAKERWQAYTLAHMFQNPDSGMQEELYKAMAVAKQLNLLDESESRWDEALSRSEAIDLIINTQLAKNSLHGYLTETEYGDIENLNEVKAEVPNTDTTITVAQPTESTSVYTLDNLTELQQEKFDEYYDKALKYREQGYSDKEIIDEGIEQYMSSAINLGLLPDNARELFNEYLNDKGFFEEQNNNNTGSSQDSGNTGNQGSSNTGSQTDNSSNDNGGQQNYTPPVQNETAPQPSYEQQQQTKQDDIPQTKEEMAQRDKEVNDIGKLFGKKGTEEGMARR